MADTILYLTAVLPDGKVERHWVRIAPGSQLRVNFPEGRLGRAFLLKPLRTSAAEAPRPDGRTPAATEAASTAADPGEPATAPPSLIR